MWPLEGGQLLTGCKETACGPSRYNDVVLCTDVNNQHLDKKERNANNKRNKAISDTNEETNRLPIFLRQTITAHCLLSTDILQRCMLHVHQSALEIWYYQQGIDKYTANCRSTCRLENRPKCRLQCGTNCRPKGRPNSSVGHYPFLRNTHISNFRYFSN